jgi:hypothetical protein
MICFFAGDRCRVQIEQKSSNEINSTSFVEIYFVIVIVAKSDGIKTFKDISCVNGRNFDPD